jgi:hypothetical protein
MAYRFVTTKIREFVEFPGVKVLLRKMTEGRRFELRTKMAEPNLRLRDIARKQEEINKSPEADREIYKWMELSDESDEIVLKEVNRIWIEWGVKQIEGLESDDKVLTIEDWQLWPSALTALVIEAVKEESELNGAERKNSESDSTSGKQAEQSPKALTARPASKEDTTEQETADVFSLTE